MRSRNDTIIILTLVFSVLAGWSLGVSANASAAEKPDKAAVFSVVNGERVTLQRYIRTFQRGLRTRFYHGKPPESELLSYKKEVGLNLIDAVLLEQQARHLGMKPDGQWVSKRLARQMDRLRKDPRWNANQEKQVEAALRRSLERESLLQQLIAHIKDIPPPDEKQLTAYYRRYPEKFSNPGKVHARVILLKVEPYAGTQAWVKAKEQADGILKRIRAGEDFGELARRYSGDPSAEQGGDLGYLHRGMLGETAKKVLDELRPGQVSEPVQLLEGFSLLKLEERQAAHLNPLSRVRKRAIQLWLREHRELALEEELERLRARAKVEVVDGDYLAVPGVKETLRSKGWSMIAGTAGG